MCGICPFGCPLNCLGVRSFYDTDNRNQTTIHIVKSRPPLTKAVGLGDDGDDTDEDSGDPGSRAGAAELNLTVEGGRILFYPSRGEFVAHCGNKDHGRCVLTRTRYGKVPDDDPDAVPLGGRPLGMLLAWLACNGQDTKAGHWTVAALNRPLDERMYRRTLLMASDDPMASELLGKERPLADGEPDEPVTLEGYITGLH